MVYIFGAIALTHWCQDSVADIFRTPISNAFSSLKIYKFRLRFHWRLFPMIQIPALVQIMAWRWPGGPFVTINVEPLNQLDSCRNVSYTAMGQELSNATWNSKRFNVCSGIRFNETRRRRINARFSSHSAHKSLAAKWEILPNKNWWFQHPFSPSNMPNSTYTSYGVMDLGRHWFVAMVCCLFGCSLLPEPMLT